MLVNLRRPLTAVSTCQGRRAWINSQLHPVSAFPSIMSNESPALIDRSIAHLERLAAFLADEIQQPWTTTTALPLSDRRLCKEALLTISVLLPKLQAVRRAGVSSSQPQRPHCQSCDD